MNYVPSSMWTRRTSRPAAKHPQSRLKTSISASSAATQIKEKLDDELKGLDRGIFGVTSAKKQSIHYYLEQLEAENQNKSPVDELGSLLDGSWKLEYSTIVISGVKRSKLGLREFVRLGDFTQTIDSNVSLATNTIDFSVTGLGFVRGSLSLIASFERDSPSRVKIELKEAKLQPTELQKLFEANYDLLLSIFNPSGHLDLSYVDEIHRIGRDDKGNIFYMRKI